MCSVALSNSGHLATNSTVRLQMNKIECYIAGKKIASGVLKKDGRIEAHGDDFEKPSDMFQTFMNKLQTPGEHQLHFIRAFYNGVSNHPNQCVK